MSSKRSIHDGPHPLSSLRFAPGDYEPELAAKRAKERLNASIKYDWPAGLVALVDTREQHPWVFPVQEVATLKTGDYSVKGHEHDGVVIERKSISDAYTSIGSGRGGKFKAQRDRFRREWERLAAFKYPCVIIEGTMGQLATQPDTTLVKPATVIGTYRRWSLRHRVPVWFANNRRMAQRFAMLMLVDFWKLSLRGEV